MGTKAVQKSVCCLVFRFQSKLINNGWGPPYLLATQIPVIQCQVPLTRSSVCWQGYSTDKYLHPCDCERKRRGKRSRENRPHGWHEFLESHFEPLSIQPACKWEVIDSGTVEAFFFCPPVKPPALQMAGCISLHGFVLASPPGCPLSPTLIFILLYFLTEFLKELHLLRGEMLLQTCSFLGASVIEENTPCQRNWRRLNSWCLIFKLQLQVEGKLWLALWRVEVRY